MNDAKLFQKERARGSSIGATIMGGFGAAWLTLGMTSAGVALSVALAVVLPVLVLIAFLGFTARRRLPKLDGPETPEKRRMMRAFAVVNVVQWVAIFGTVNLLHHFHRDAWIVSVIVLIVGAHFIPLAQIFHAPEHVKTGIAMMLCAAVAVVLPVSVRDTAFRDTAFRDTVECVSAGLILWASAAAALWTAFRMTPPARLAAEGL